MVCVSTVRSDCAVAAFGADGSFNVEMAITELLADPNRASLKLPCLLSAEQRKHAKKEVEQHPDLKCESFGFGKDRQMHVFKCKSGENSDRSPHLVSVKNTFIDDWVDVDSMPADERVVQSMPHNMFGQCLSAQVSGYVSTEDGEDLTASLTTTKEAVPEVSHEVGVTTQEEDLFALGTEVVIDGLVKAPSFNGAAGVVQSWDAESGRYNVLLASTAANGQRWAKIKGENLQKTEAHSFIKSMSNIPFKGENQQKTEAHSFIKSMGNIPFHPF